MIKKSIKLGNSKSIELTVADGTCSIVPEFSIKFVNNSEVTVPGRYGSYVVASGCGSGKTTAIRELILQLYPYGVVYSAATIEECNKMYKFLADNGDSVGLTKDDIVVLHSDYEDPGVDLNMMRNDCNALADKKVIICTHHKLLNEHPYIFMNYSYNLSYVPSRVSRSHQAMIGIPEMSMIKLPRQNVFIDEVPTCSSISINIDTLKASLFFKPTYVKYDYPTPVIDCNEMLDRGYIRQVNNDRIDDIRIIDQTCQDFSKPLGMFIEDCESNKLKNKIISDLIFDNQDLLRNMPNGSNITLTKTISSLAYSDGNTRLVLFEGTGDLTFHGSKEFRLITSSNRYNSPIVLDDNPIEFNIKRSYKNIVEFQDGSEFRKKEWYKVIESLISIIKDNSSTGTLIVCWRNYKIRSKDSENYIDESVNEQTPQYNESFFLPKFIESELTSRGVIGGYEIIHYMSGLDKATNQFRDCNQIVFLGDFQIPDKAVDKFNFDYKVETTPELFRLYQMVQAVCRTRIRNNNGDTIRISYTSDINPKYINMIKNYLNNTPVDNLAKISNGLNFIKPKWRPIIEKLCDLNYDLKSSLLLGTPYRFEVDLDLMYELLPMSKKEVRKYYPLINYLSKFNISMVIPYERTYGNRYITGLKKSSN